MPIERHPKIQADANPYDKAWHAYFAKRGATKSASHANLERPSAATP